MNCSKCGGELQSGQKFCPICGKYNKVGQQTPTPSPTPSFTQPVAPPMPRTAPKPPPPRQFTPAPVAPPQTPPPTISVPSNANFSASIQVANVVEPWGEVNVATSSHAKRILATLLTYEVQEGTKTGLAIDGSLSMKKLYGGEKKTFFGAAGNNEVEPIARKMCTFLAETVDCTGKTSVMYWACGNMGAEVEPIGDVSAQDADQMSFPGPQRYGKGTRLMPSLTHFEEASRTYPFAMFVIITDGALDDIEDVKEFTTALAQQIEAGQRNPFKGVFIGLGPEVDEAQLVALDDLETGTDVDIWDHKLAQNLRQVWDIFAEVVSKNQIVAPSGRILDQNGRLLKDYPKGLPAVLELDVPTETTHIILEAAGNRAEPQPLS